MGDYLPSKAILGKVMKNSASVMIPPHEMELHDRVATVTMTKLAELLLQTPEALVGRKVVAAIVMTDNNNNLSRVVSLGTGNRCVHGNKITEDGTVLHDSHAEILAKRGFKRYLYALLVHDPLCLLNKGEDEKFRFKPHITFHLYISVAPCGDGALFVPSDGTSGNGCRGDEHNPIFNKPQTQALMRAKQENGEGTVPIMVDEVGQTYDGIVHGGRLRIMSCSDKICMWNVVGLQGALLSQVFQPIYLKSITCGDLFNPGHLSRALCCRIDLKREPLSRSLPPGYRVNHPDFGVPKIQTTRGVEKARSYCMNWTMGDSEPEITDGSTGLTLKSIGKPEGPSRLCKRKLLWYHRSIISDKSTTMKTYKMYKLDADDYNLAKEAFRQRMMEQNYGSWIRMPQEMERFTG
ncbi:hypothetical protein DPMN_063206 [Dreissena polymorpha]|uniref:A to I editase domain-containing protein n=1 Tax=Dreissena polymorpha TaxID=45954 RepID=A0A9D4CAX7_DREPO|nr:hypothetical protein DPMN_063206 [Dreissena polymorpha]